ncbi:hypothetical protein ES703_120952 [subsurface metagenome]
MSKRKYPSELNSRTIRVNIGDWQLLLELSRRGQTTVAETFHRLLTEIAHRDATVVPKSQIEHRDAIVVPKSQIPRPAFVASSPITFQVKPQPTMVINGNKASVFVIKPKGGVIRE